MTSTSILRALWPAAMVFIVAFQAADAIPRPKSGPEAAIAKDYVLAACLIQNYPNSPIAEEAELWAEGLVQRGSIPAQTYSKLAELAKNAREPQTSRTGKRMLLQSCIELYNDPKLAARILRLLSR
jgi:hypothetical protein